MARHQRKQKVSDVREPALLGVGCVYQESHPSLSQFKKFWDCNFKIQIYLEIDYTYCDRSCNRCPDVRLWWNIMYCYQYVPHVPANHSASSSLVAIVLNLSSRAVVSKISKDMSHSFYYLLVMLGILHLNEGIEWICQPPSNRTRSDAGCMMWTDKRQNKTENSIYCIQNLNMPLLNSGVVIVSLIKLINGTVWILWCYLNYNVI